MDKKSDSKIINNIWSKDTNYNLNKKDKTKYHPVINRIIEYLRKNNHSASIHVLQKEIKDFTIVGNADLIKHIQSKTGNLKYDEATEYFSISSKYNINNIEELKDKIKSCEFGLPENEELHYSYPKITEDIERLKSENQIKVINNEEKKYDVLFYRNMDDPIEILLNDKSNADALDFIRKTWKDIKAHENFEDPKIYGGNRKKKISESKKEKKRKLKNKNYANKHIDKEFLFGYNLEPSKK